MSNNSHPLHIGIIAGEASGDNIAAGLIHAIREKVPETLFEGIAGPRMRDAGCFSLYPMERLSVMGLTEVVRHLPGLLSMRRELRRHFLETLPDIFIGVDAPDFNLALARQLKQAGIRTLHYVSPSVWAWRRYRVRKIAESIDCMLTLFPFEEQFYREHGIPVRCVGHPMADLIADEVDAERARLHLEITHTGPLVALLPGSREGEVRRMAPLFIRAAAWCHERCSDMQFVVPLANAACRTIFESVLSRLGSAIPVTLLTHQSLEAMAAADVVLTASGTATLEGMLLKRPMAVAYRLAPITYFIARMMVHSRYYSLPNLLADQPLVREFIQAEATPEAMGGEILSLLEDRERAEKLSAVFSRIHEELRRDANHAAAAAVLEMVGRQHVVV